MPRPGENKFSFDSPHCSFDDAFGYGYTGTPDVVRAMCLHADRETKLNVLMGCQTGFITGHFENMQVFLATWVSHHLPEIRADKGEVGEDTWKKDTEVFVCKTTVAVIEKSKYPAAAAKVLVMKMTDDEKQQTLDLLLRHASARKNSVVVEAVIEAGANVNTMGGIAVKNALSGEPVDVPSLRVLHKKGADFMAAAGTWSLPVDDLRTWDARLTKEETTATIDAFRTQVKELTGEVEDLRTRLKKYEPDAENDKPAPPPKPPAAPGP
jgi:hypothetical protein